MSLSLILLIVLILWLFFGFGFHVVSGLLWIVIIVLIIGLAVSYFGRGNRVE